MFGAEGRRWQAGACRHPIVIGEGVFGLSKRERLRSIAPMKRYASLLLLVAMLASLVAPFAFAAAAAPAAADKSPSAPFATAISTVTGIAISPLLGTAGYGAYQYVTAKDDAARAALPWYAQIKFWVPAILIVGVCAAKDALGAAVPPGWKKPLDVLETVENKTSGLVAAGAVVPFAMDTFTKMFFDGSATAAGPLFGAHGLAAMDLTWLANVLTVPFGIAVFAVVWLASHTINVLILLSPWGAIDAALKTGRTALLGLVTLSATIDPKIGAVLSLVVIVISFLIAGWAFRLTVFGSVFCWDFLTGRKRRFKPEANANKMFSASAFPKIPMRSYGRLVKREDGTLEFAYKRWPWMPTRTVPVPASANTLAVGEGLFFSDIVTADSRSMFSLPPRYRGHETTVVAAYALDGIKPAGLRKAWSVLREMLGGNAVKQKPVAA